MGVTFIHGARFIFIFLPNVVGTTFMEILRAKKSKEKNAILSLGLSRFRQGKNSP